MLSAIDHLKSMFLLLCEAKELAAETHRRVDPAGYLCQMTRRLVAGDRERGHRIWQQC